MAKKTSGLDTRLIGQALAGPRPLGTDEILGDAFKRGEIAINKMQAKRDAEEKEKKQLNPTEVFKQYCENDPSALECREYDV